MSKEDVGRIAPFVVEPGHQRRLATGNRRMVAYWRLAPNDRIVTADELHNTLVENARKLKRK